MDKEERELIRVLLYIKQLIKSADSQSVLIFNLIKNNLKNKLKFQITWQKKEKNKYFYFFYI